jgi:uncharacterized protein (DUF433 family)
MMAATVLHISEIVSDPKIRGGRPIIAGTTLRVSDVAAHYVYGGFTAEDMSVGFQLTLGQVHAALAYYHLNKPEIDAEIRANNEEAEKLLQEIKRQGRLITLE